MQLTPWFVFPDFLVAPNFNPLVTTSAMESESVAKWRPRHEATHMYTFHVTAWVSSPPQMVSVFDGGSVNYMTVRTWTQLTAATPPVSIPDLLLLSLWWWYCKWPELGRRPGKETSRNTHHLLWYTYGVTFTLAELQLEGGHRRDKEAPPPPKMKPSLGCEVLWDNIIMSGCGLHTRLLHIPLHAVS